MLTQTSDQPSAHQPVASLMQDPAGHGLRPSAVIIGFAAFFGMSVVGLLMCAALVSIPYWGADISLDMAFDEIDEAFNAYGLEFVLFVLVVHYAGRVAAQRARHAPLLHAGLTGLAILTLSAVWSSGAGTDSETNYRIAEVVVAVPMALVGGSYVKRHG